VTKKAFDEEDAHKEITRLKNEIKFLQKQTKTKTKQSSMLGSQKENSQDYDSNIKLANAMNT
jgi:hypothetical protein